MSPWDRGGITEGLKGLSSQDLSDSRGPMVVPSHGMDLPLLPLFATEDLVGNIEI